MKCWPFGTGAYTLTQLGSFIPNKKIICGSFRRVAWWNKDYMKEARWTDDIEKVKAHMAKTASLSRFVAHCFVWDEREDENIDINFQSEWIAYK